MNVQVSFTWYDFWVGWYWDRASRALYICPLPMVVVRIGTCERCEENAKGWRPLCERHRAAAPRTPEPAAQKEEKL